MSKLGSWAQIWKTPGDIMVIYVNEEMNINELSEYNGDTKNSTARPSIGFPKVWRPSFSN